MRGYGQSLGLLYRSVLEIPRLYNYTHICSEVGQAVFFLFYAIALRFNGYPKIQCNFPIVDFKHNKHNQIHTAVDYIPTSYAVSVPKQHAYYHATRVLANPSPAHPAAQLVALQ